MALYPGSTTFPHVDTFPAPVVTVFNRLYKPAQVASAFGGDVYTFDYAHADVADTFTYGAGNWGNYHISSGDLNVTDAVRPVANDQAAIVFNVLTSHLDNVSSAHIHYEGEGIVVSYTTNNAFTVLDEDIAINLTTANDLLVMVEFPGGIENAQLTSLTVYLMASERFKSPKGRILTFGAPTPITEAGLKLGTNATIAPVPNYDFEQIPEVTFTQAGTPPTIVGTAEMWCQAPNGANGILVSGFKNADWTFNNSTSDNNTTAMFTEDIEFSSYATLNQPVTFVGKYAYVQLSPPINDEASKTYMEITSAGGANTLFWEVYLDNMTAGYTLGGVETDVYSQPYDATAHRWCRIREDQGTVYWEASPDGVNWTFLGSTLSTFDTTNSTIKIGAGNDRGETIPPIVASNFQLGDVSGLFGQPGTVYIDGVPGRRVPSDGQYHHVVVVLDSPGNVQFALGPVITIDHLALYPQTMSAAQVADLFLHSNGGSRLISVVDSLPFSVTQGSPEVDVYAYSWSVVSGGTA